MVEVENHGNWLLSATLLFGIWSALMFCVRVWAKLNVRRWGIDDYAVTVAFAISILDVAAIFAAIKRGYGASFDRIRVEDQRALLYAAQQFYILAMGFCRISTALFLVRLAYPGPQVKPSYIMAGISGAWTMASMLTVALRGNLHSPWTTVDGTGPLHARWIAVEVTGLVIEFLLLMLSIKLVNGLHLNAQKRLVVLSVFSVRLLLIPLVIARLYLLSPAVNTKPTFTSIVPSIVSEATLHFSVIFTSVTSLRPFVRTFHVDCRVDGRTKSKHNIRSGDDSRPLDSYHRLDNLRDSDANRQESNTFGWRAVAYPARTHVYATHKSSGAEATVSEAELISRRSNEATPSSQSYLADTMAIQKTVSWSFQYEQSAI
ncbi:hypothetical protein VFPPC_16769 [Pochonia chlamydosporia 170]|uniref:Rhodopsin domain-containing protein n=1 Tax=Pochonia chlamydosporia 170 TaxID=1380566 RepID=A0A179F605_METCM|nr:hypothetical protein VFPPC_16769 [Pochonia chlamydosporia 170]OAQ60790.1 hypothetical protein VFPPC_16769 [Pochonia chlamydosporia 170]